MPLETATYLDTLQPDWPLGTDPESQGDDHLRMIKQVLQNTFPAFNSAIAGTSANMSAISTGLIYTAADAGAGTTEKWDLYDAAVPGNHAPIGILGVTGAAASANPALAVNWSMIQNLIYPVHSVIVSTNAANPATYLDFGTWTARAGSIYGVGAVADGAGLSETIPVGPLSGRWRVLNTHIVAQALSLTGGTTNSAGAHQHSFTTANSYWGDSNHTALMAGTSGSAQGSSMGTHTHSVTGTITIGSDTQTSGSPFQTPGYAFYVWERTA